MPPVKDREVEELSAARDVISAIHIALERMATKADWDNLRRALRVYDDAIGICEKDVSEWPIEEDSP